MITLAMLQGEGGGGGCQIDVLVDFHRTAPEPFIVDCYIFIKHYLRYNDQPLEKAKLVLKHY